MVADFSEFGLAEPRASYTLRRRGGTNEIHSQLTFGKAAGDSGDHLYVKRGDEDSVYVVAKSAHESLPTYSYQLRHRQLWEFSEKDVVKLTVTDEDKVVTLERNFTGQWTRPGRPLAANELRDIKTTLSFLGKFRVVNWISQGNDKLDLYDISLRKSFKLGFLKGGERLIQFGKNSPEGNPYAFAKDRFGKEVVFEFPSNIFDLCKIGLFPLASVTPEND